jgi:hypothetical protein
MENKKHNGYFNYETWRVMLEILGDIEWDADEEVTEDLLEEIVNDVVFSNSVEKDCLAADYARSFLSNVNYYELAEIINEDRKDL